MNTGSAWDPGAPPLALRPRLSRRAVIHAVCCAGVLLAAGTACRISPPQVETKHWQAEWELPDGFSIEIDVEGFDFPTAIAFVPNPGPGPKAPLYFVTEIRGKVKVITRDRSVFTFAENSFSFAPTDELPSTSAESGMGGITLDPAHGYVFVSFAYHDRHRVLRNNIVRFDSEPGIFGLKARGATAFTEIFKDDIAAVTHQVGDMVLQGETLLVGVGDGGQHFKSQDLNFTLGKILRMTLDGTPVPDNPFYEDQEIGNPANFVWARGLRNPFGLCLVDGRLFATENGFDIDRFIEIRRGDNYGWDGTDWSIGMNALIVFGPTTVAPVHLAWLPGDNPLFPPQYRSRFFVALHGGKSYLAGVTTLEHDFTRSRMASPPRQFALHTTEKRNRVMPVGVAFGPDGLYVVPLFPVRREKNARGAVLRVAYAPAKAYQRSLGPDEKVEATMAQKGCYSCHGRQPTELNVAPPLDRETMVPRILRRLGSREYPLRVREVDKLEFAPYAAYRNARREVLAASGNERARLWIKYHVLEPRFDQTASAMPTLELTEQEAQDIADYLIRRNIGDTGVTASFRRMAQPYLYGPATRRHLPGAFAMGFLSACGLVVTWRVARGLAARRRALRAAQR